MTLEIPKTDVNVIDAAARGTGEGLHLMLDVIAMLVSFMALVALLNGGWGAIHRYARAGFPEPPDRARAGSSVRSPG